jgi:hypothetical protein
VVADKETWIARQPDWKIVIDDSYFIQATALHLMAN